MKNDECFVYFENGFGYRCSLRSDFSLDPLIVQEGEMRLFFYDSSTIKGRSVALVLSGERRDVPILQPLESIPVLRWGSKGVCLVRLSNFERAKSVEIVNNLSS